VLNRILRQLKKNLGEHNNIIGKERKYRNAAVLIPIVEVNKEVHMLFQVRADHIRQGGEISFPGGMVEEEDGGDYQATAVRETVEELGISKNNIEVISYLGTYVAGYDVTIEVYVGVLDIKNIEALPLSEEVASVFTVPLKWLDQVRPETHYIDMQIQPRFVDEEGDEVVLLDAKSLGLSDRYEKPYKNKKRKLYFYRYEAHTIWGMTGEILFEFLAILKNE